MSRVRLPYYESTILLCKCVLHVSQGRNRFIHCEIVGLRISNQTVWCWFVFKTKDYDFYMMKKGASTFIHEVYTNSTGRAGCNELHCFHLAQYILNVTKCVNLCLQKDAKEISSTYTQNPVSMLQYRYISVMFVCQKPHEPNSSWYLHHNHHHGDKQPFHGVTPWSPWLPYYEYGIQWRIWKGVTGLATLLWSNVLNKNWVFCAMLGSAILLYGVEMVHNPLFKIFWIRL